MRGAGLSELWFNVAVLVSYTAVVLVAATLLFKKRIG